MSAEKEHPDDTVIDVWDVETFDPALRLFLDDHQTVIADYWAESQRLFIAREAQTVRGPPEENVYGFQYQRLKEDAAVLLKARTIRAWHFTRLTDPEVAAIRTDGMRPMSLELIERRLSQLVKLGIIDRATAHQLFAASPYHRQFQGNREGRIWLSAQPYPLDDSGVTGLMGGWGGESVNFDHLDGPIAKLLWSIGQPRVIEVSLPLAVTTRAYQAAENVLDSFSFTLGCNGGWGGGADIVAVEPIKPGWIRAIHSPGERQFEAMGRGYPARFKADE